MKNITLIGFSMMICLHLCTSVKAQQDEHFSMFTVTQSLLNPAATGHFGGDAMFFTNYRNQWSSITPKLYNTISANIEGKVLDGQVGNGFLGVGGYFVKDDASQNNFRRTALGANISYSVQLDRNNYLSFGISPSLRTNQILTSNLTWNSQWTGSEFNTVLNNNELFGTYKKSSFDISSGVFWNFKPSDYSRVYAGISGLHLNKPQLSLTNDDRLYSRVLVHGGCELGNQSSKLIWKPNAFLFFQGPNREITVGMDVEYELQEKSKYMGYYNRNSISGGLYYRTGDAIFANVQFNWTGFSAGFSYDINVSGLTVATNSLGGMELFLRYIIASQNGSKSRI